MDPRDRILATTVALLGEIGWAQITTRRVAQRADVNNALINYYFGTKARLLVEAATQVMLHLFETPLALLADPAVEVADAVVAAVEWLGRTDIEPTKLRALTEVTVNGLREPALASQTRSMLAEARAALASRFTETGLDPVRADGSAAIVLALLDGLMLHRIVDPDVRFDAVPNALAPLLGTENP